MYELVFGDAPLDVSWSIFGEEDILDTLRVLDIQDFI